MKSSLLTTTMLLVIIGYFAGPWIIAERRNCIHKYPEYVAAMKKQLDTTLKSQRISQDIAVQFLDEVESRAKGKIPSPILETLLNYQFKERPANEFARGFKRIYRTKGHRKAKGLDLQIEGTQKTARLIRGDWA